MTKKYKKLAIIFYAVSFALLVAPAAVFGVKALFGGALVVQKTAFVFSVFLSLILALVGLIRKVAFKSSIWLVGLGLYFCLDKILQVILVFAVTQVANELIIEPLAKHYLLKYRVNKEMDARLGEAD